MRPDAEIAESLVHLLTPAVLSSDFRRATFGGVKRGDRQYRWQHVIIRPIALHSQPHWQFSYYDTKKHITKNVTADVVTSALNELLNVGFAGIHVTTADEEIDVRTTKKGQIHVGRRKVTNTVAAPEPHNRVKDVPLPEGRCSRVLEVMGVLDRTGRVRPAMRAKFTQINEFLKQLTHVLPDAGLHNLGRPIEILDCGCGSSFLTLAAHHYLNDVIGTPTNIIGVDINDELIRKSVERSQQLGGRGVNFTCATIGATTIKPDVVFALHACDTATDDAIAKAINAEAKLFLGVPCCHHHLNEQLRAAGPAEVLRPMLRHGILLQRTADLVTDAFRALTLRIMGYRAEVVEFVGTEHTPRNLMIRAIRGVPVGEAKCVKEYLELRRFWGVKPYLESLLDRLPSGQFSKMRTHFHTSAD